MRTILIGHFNSPEQTQAAIAQLSGGQFGADLLRSEPEANYLVLAVDEQQMAQAEQMLAAAGATSVQPGAPETWAGPDFARGQDRAPQMGRPDFARGQDRAPQTGEPDFARGQDRAPQTGEPDFARGQRELGSDSR